jgi:carbon storage regulator
MLVLARREGESIKIGGDIVIKVTRITGNQVKIAIDAPKNLNIMREELIKKLIAENVGVKHVNPVRDAFAP